ncbi:MAG: biopolymer transporter ExbD [Lentisphaerota bacterium]
MRKRRFQSSPFDEINMIPLIDITFFLLIIFLMMMPIIEYGTSVAPPELNSNPLPEDYKTVAIDKDGRLIYDKRVITQEQLLDELRKLKINSPKTTLLLRADGARSYKEVILLMKTIKNSGYKNISLVTQAEGAN